MPYQLVPNAGQSLLDTRDVIRENFNIITTAQSVNHVAFDDSGQGKHKFLQIPEINTQSPSTIPTTGVDEGAIYTSLSGSTTRLFFRDESNGSSVQLNPQALVSFPAFGEAVGDIVPQYSYNILPVTGVKKTATGRYTITFKNNVNSAFYIVNMGFVDDSGNIDKDNHTGKVVSSSRTTASFQIQTVRGNNTSFDDPRSIMISVWGG